MTERAGMTRERWEEIKAIVVQNPCSYSKGSNELVAWIDGAATLDKGLVLEFDEPKPVVIDGLPKVELCKGFVGITADGRKVEVISDPSSIGQMAGVVEGMPEGDRVGYYADGSLSSELRPPALRIVAPYPPEKPFASWKTTKRYRVLDKSTGEIVTFRAYGTTQGYNPRPILQNELDNYLFNWDGTQGVDRVEGLDRYRVLGPVEEAVRKHAPSLETKAEPVRLEEALSEGEWFISDEQGRRFKGHLRASLVCKGWIVEAQEPLGDGFQQRIVTHALDSFAGEFHIAGRLYQLIRRVREPKVEPYDLLAFTNELIRRYDAGQDVHSIELGNLSIVGAKTDAIVFRRERDGKTYEISWKEAAEKSVWSSDGTNLGTLTHDDGT